MSIEGQLRIELGCRDNQVRRVCIQSSRPLGLSMQFRDKRVDEVLRTIPLLYSICGTAQANAAVMACRQALGLVIEPRIALAETMLVCFETAREHLWRVLIDWPEDNDEEVDRQQLPGLSMLLPEAKQALFHPNSPAFCLQPRLQSQIPGVAGLIDRLSQTLERTVFGMPADAWQGIDSVAGLEGWIGDKSTMAARYLARLMDGDMARLGAISIAALPAIEETSLHRRLRQADADAFIASPQWREEPRETTPLIRQMDHPLIGAMAAAYGMGLLTRLVARLLELASIPDRLSDMLQRINRETQPPPSKQPEPALGQGLGVVEAARGRLIHRVCVQGESVERYQILAPTEWNFHPEGAVARGLLGLSSTSGFDLERQASLFVKAVDPCVGYRIEFV